MVFSAAVGHWHITGQRIDLTRKSHISSQNADNTVAYTLTLYHSSCLSLQTAVVGAVWKP